MTRTSLTRRGDVYDLTCDELRSTWIFTEAWLALQAQFSLFKILSWWHDGGGKSALHHQDLDQLVKFVMRAYEQPLTADVFRSLLQGAGEPSEPMFSVDEPPRWFPKVVEGGKS